MAENTVHIGFVKAELGALQDDTEKVEQILKNADISPSLIDNSSIRVSSEQYRSVYLSVANHFGDELAGQGRGKIPHGFFHTLCKHAIHGEKLLNCLRRTITYCNLFQELSGQRYEIEQTDTKSIVKIAPISGEKSNPFLVERGFLNIYKFIAWAAGSHLQLAEANFTFPPPVHMKEYQHFFYCRLNFNENENSLVYNTKDLMRRPVHAEKDLREMLKGAPPSFWIDSSHSFSYSALTRKAISESTLGEHTDLESIANKLNISSITLRRRLSKENTSFQEIKDNHRRDTAIILLMDRSKSVADVADILGYSDPSAFYRAFKLWVGITPNQYRKDNKFA